MVEFTFHTLIDKANAVHLCFLPWDTYMLAKYYKVFKFEPLMVVNFQLGAVSCPPIQCIDWIYKHASQNKGNCMHAPIGTKIYFLVLRNCRLINNASRF